MRLSTKRALVAAAFFILIVIGLFIDTGLGTPCSFGWDYIASVCPVGVIAAFLAGRSVPVTGVICLAITVVLALLLGRAFCGWLCPVPLERRVFGGRHAADRSASASSCVGVMADAGIDLRTNNGRRMHAPHGNNTADQDEKHQDAQVSAMQDELYDEYYHPFARASQKEAQTGAASRSSLGSAQASERQARAEKASELDFFDEYYGDRFGKAAVRNESAASTPRREEGQPASGNASALVGAQASVQEPIAEGRMGIREVRQLAQAQLTDVSAGHVRIRSSKSDIRLAVLAIALITALLFGFPVFCLVCPVGLTFATLVSFVEVVRSGVFSWGVVVFPAVIVFELLVFRRWCHTLCPIGALLGLFARGNRTLRPTVDESLCIETAHHASCGRCHLSCPEGIDPHRPGSAVHISECTKCAECVFACPAGALTMPFLPRKGGAAPTSSQAASSSSRAVADMERAVEEKLGPVRQ
jgi:polyferredoxin